MWAFVIVTDLLFYSLLLANSCSPYKDIRKNKKLLLHSRPEKTEWLTLTSITFLHLSVTNNKSRWIKMIFSISLITIP
jgi:hypothetical protein